MNIDQLFKKMFPEIAQAFSLAVADIVDRATLKDIANAVQAGDAERVFRLLGYGEAAMRPITSAIERAYEAGGMATGATFPRRLFTPDGPAVFRFDVRNVRAEKWIKERSASLVERIGEDTRQNIKNILFAGNEKGRNPRNLALDIVGRYDRSTNRRVGGVVGINQNQQKFVANMRNDLDDLDERYFTRELRDRRFDGIVRNAFDQGNVNAELKNSLVGKYHDRMLKLRGETIARDAAMEALNHADHEAMKQAQDMGAMGKSGVQRFWDSAGPDGRTRNTHLAMDRHKPVGLDEPFVFPNGVRVMFPQDRSLPNDRKNLAKETINCRCKVRTKIDWLSEVN